MRKSVTATFVVASRAILLLSERASCFHINRCGHNTHHHHRGHHHHHHHHHHHRHRRRSRRHLASIGDDDASWEEKIREEATDTLLPVFFPKDHSRPKPITAEASLKKLLRKKYQRQNQQQQQQQHDDDDDDDDDVVSTNEETPERTANEYRGRLAALTLGTSVMRLRHWYAVASSENSIMARGAHHHHHHVPIPIPYPLDPSIISLLLPQKGDNADNSVIDGLEQPSSGTENEDNSAEERLLARAMVDEHARCLISTTNPVGKIASNSNNVAMNLSIQYSLPSFITESLHSQYGYAQTEHICSLMNNPGPITIRRNAIQFPGTDEDLCEWLWEEDEIRAEPLSKLLIGGSFGNASDAQHHHRSQSNELMMSAPSEGSNVYVMGSSSKAGYVVPPEGTIQILPPPSNATTAVEKRRNNKSIWSMKAWQNGYFEVQDAGSQAIVKSVEAVPGESILDYCAGNGGKTFALASSIMNAAAGSAPISQNGTNDNAKALRSRIVAHDVVDERLRQIRGSLSRVGFVAQEEDAAIHFARNGRGNCKCTILVSTSSDLEESHNTAYFDAVLVDAPCSSTGVLRRRPSQRWDLTEEHTFRELPNLQLEILKNASSFVKDGGKLVYSTCSLFREENECVVRQFEQSDEFRNGGFERWEFVPSMSNVEVQNDTDISRSSQICSHTLTLLPSQKGSDGFFIARWKRRGANII